MVFLAHEIASQSRLVRARANNNNNNNNGEDHALTSPDASKKKQKMEQLCQRIRSNDPTLTVLHLDGVEHDSTTVCDCLDSLTSAFPFNDCISKVKIGQHIVQSPIDLDALLLNLGFLGGLKHLEITLWDEFKKRRQVRASVVAQFLKQSTTVELFVFWPFLYMASDDDLVRLNQALYQHPSLQQLHVVNILRYSTDQCLSSFVDTLSTIPNLTHVQLAPGYLLKPTKGILSYDQSVQCLVRLVQQSQRLEALTLRNVGLSNDHVRALAEALVVDDKNPSKNTPTLRHLNLRYNLRLNELGFVHFARALERDQCCELQYLELDWKNASNNAKCQELKHQLEFYLRLNRVGRRAFVKNGATFQDRVNALIACNQPSQDGTDDSSYGDGPYSSLDLIFHLLQRNPAVVCEAADSSE